MGEHPVDSIRKIVNEQGNIITGEFKWAGNKYRVKLYFKPKKLIETPIIWLCEMNFDGTSKGEAYPDYPLIDYVLSYLERVKETLEQGNFIKIVNNERR